MEPVPLNFWANSRGSTRNLQPEIKSKLPVIEAVFQEVLQRPTFKIVITAGQEWHNGHGLMSRHHTGYAVDIQTKTLMDGGVGATTERIAKKVRDELGGGYLVLTREPGHAPHMHIEFRAGTKMSNPLDYEPGKQFKPIA